MLRAKIRLGLKKTQTNSEKHSTTSASSFCSPNATHSHRAPRHAHRRAACRLPDEAPSACARAGRRRRQWNSVTGQTERSAWRRVHEARGTHRERGVCERGSHGLIVGVEFTAEHKQRPRCIRCSLGSAARLGTSGGCVCARPRRAANLEKSLLLRAHFECSEPRVHRRFCYRIHTASGLFLLGAPVSCARASEWSRFASVCLSIAIAALLFSAPSSVLLRSAEFSGQAPV